MNRKHFKAGLITGSAGICASLLGLQPVLAADETSVRRLEEVVVTARKREESLNSIPEAITAFTATEIENARIESLRGFVDLTPNMIVRETFRSNDTFITLRGISTPQGGLPATSLIIDGVQQGSNEFINQDLLDVESIEILKGPQGALFGQGAIAGAINITTKAPGNETDGFIKASYGNGNSYKISGGFSAPLVEDEWFLRVSGYHRDKDGLIQNVRGEDVSFADETSLRARLMYEGEKLKLSLRGSVTDGEAGAAIQDLPVLDDSGNPVDPDGIGAPTIKGGGITSNIVGREKNELEDLSLRVDYELSFATLTSVTGYASSEQDLLADADFVSVDVVLQDLLYTSEVFNQEFRLTSSVDQPFRWIAGVYYQDRDSSEKIFVNFQPGFGGGTILDTNLEDTSESFAVFANFDYDITEDLELTVGLRYDEDEQTSVDTNNPGPTAAEAKFDKFQPKVQLSKQWGDDLLGYITYAEGFRSGGFSQSEKFENEETENYEIGLKTTFLDGLMQLNAALFHTDYTNQQFSFVLFDAGTAKKGVLNLSDTDIDGLEIELVALPTDSLKLSFALGLTDAEIVEADEAALAVLGITQSVAGNQSPLTPDYTFNASATYTKPIGDMDLVLRGDYRRRDAYFFSPFNVIETDTQDFADASIRLQNDNWSIGLWGRNLSDVRHATYYSTSSNRNRVQNQPRSYGVEFSYKF